MKINDAVYVWSDSIKWMANVILKYTVKYKRTTKINYSSQNWCNLQCQCSDRLLGCSLAVSDLVVMETTLYVKLMHIVKKNEPQPVTFFSSCKCVSFSCRFVESEAGSMIWAKVFLFVFFIRQMGENSHF